MWWMCTALHLVLAFAVEDDGGIRGLAWVLISLWSGRQPPDEAYKDSLTPVALTPAGGVALCGRITAAGQR